MKVQDIMNNQVATCNPGMSVAEAAALMWENDCGALPVIQDEKLTGIITDRDIAIALGTRNCAASDLRVGEVMSGDIFACAPDDDIRQALKLMSECKVRRLPIINDEGSLVGILSMGDIVLQANRGDFRHTAISHEDVVATLKAISEKAAAQETGEQPPTLAAAP